MKTLEQEIKNSKPIPPGQRAMLNILFTASLVERTMSHNMRKYKLTNPQYNILRILKGSHPKGLSVLDIKERMLDKSSNVSRLVEKLKVAGLVERTVSEADKRMVIVSITQSGLDMVEAMEEVRLESETSMGKCLTKDEIILLGNLLDRYRASS